MLVLTLQCHSCGDSYAGVTTYRPPLHLPACPSACPESFNPSAAVVVVAVGASPELHSFGSSARSSLAHQCSAGEQRGYSCPSAPRMCFHLNARNCSRMPPTLSQFGPEDFPDWQQWFGDPGRGQEGATFPVWEPFTQRGPGLTLDPLYSKHRLYND